MLILVKYFSLTLFLVGLFGFTIYTYLCNFGDKFLAYIGNHFYKVEKEYDYIIVGAGSAGSVIASRLSEDPNVTVLVLEAGGFGCKLLDIPVISPILHKTIYDWQYETVPQSHACGAFQSNVSPWPMGKLIGGSGRLNNMMYTRGHPDDFKEWYRDLEGFDYERDILQYFRKAENQIGGYYNDSKYHASDGPLTANDLTTVSEMYEAVARTAKDMGFPVRDVNGKFSTGFSQPQVNVKSGSRFSTGHHLLQQHRSNLSIKVFAHVEKILLKGNYEAYAVKYKFFNDVHIVGARKGVVLSAGVVGSPKLLMLSGIGDEVHLKDNGIKPILSLPVGYNLQDHISTGFDLVLLNRPLNINFYSLSSPLNHLKYFFQSDGPLTSVGCEAFALLNTNCINNTIEYDLCEKRWGRPDLELIFMPVGLSTDNGVHFKDVVNLHKQIWDNYFSKITNYFALNILPIVLHPKSIGTIRLRDSNPSSMPIINPNYLSNPLDVDLLIQGIRFVQKFIKMPAMQELGARFNNLTFPGCEGFEFDSDDYWRCYIKQVSFTLYHPIGTCKMGNENKADSVVNYNFQVIGLNKLFVADASVVPSLVSANINAAVVMLAEKAADAIREYSHLETGLCHIMEIFVKMLVYKPF